jgi:hypothetical protein
MSVIGAARTSSQHLLLDLDRLCWGVRLAGQATMPPASERRARSAPPADRGDDFQEPSAVRGDTGISIANEMP